MSRQRIRVFRSLTALIDLVARDRTEFNDDDLGFFGCARELIAECKPETVIQMTNIPKEKITPEMLARVAKLQAAILKAEETAFRVHYNKPVRSSHETMNQWLTVNAERLGVELPFPVSFPSDPNLTYSGWAEALSGLPFQVIYDTPSFEQG